MIYNEIPKDFKEISIGDKEMVEKYIYNNVKNIYVPMISDWDFVNFIFYKEIPKFKYKIINGFLCLVGNVFNKNEIYLYPPFGEYDDNSLIDLIETLFFIFKKNKIKFSFIPYSFLSKFENLKTKYKLKIGYLRNENDYVYLINDFKKCIKKSKIRNFVRKYNPSFEIIDKNNKNICLEIQKKYWCNKNKCKGKCTYCAFSFIKNIIENYEKLDFNGIIVKNKNGYLGYMLIHKFHNNIIFHETKHAHVKGLNYYMFNILIELFGENMKWVNFTADDGILSLKLYKIHICKKYKVINKYYLEISR